MAVIHWCLVLMLVDTPPFNMVSCPVGAANLTTVPDCWVPPKPLAAVPVLPNNPPDCWGAAVEPNNPPDVCCVVEPKPKTSIVSNIKQVNKKPIHTNHCCFYFSLSNHKSVSSTHKKKVNAQKLQSF